MNDRLVAWSPLILLALLAALTFWLDRKVQAPPRLADGSTRHDPDFYVEGFSAMKMNPDGTRRYALSAKRMVHYPDDNSTHLELPRLVYFDYERAPVTVRSDTAEVVHGGDEVFFNGDVQVVRAAYASNVELGMFTSFLHVIPDKDFAKTDKPVRMVEGNSTATKVKLLTAEGADVAFFSRDQGRIDAALAAVAGNPGKAHGEAFDMTGNAEGYVAWLNAAVEKLGGCDVFIHTASASGMGATQDWQRCFDIDIMGAVHGVEVLTPALEASGAGSIIFMSSTAAVETFVMPQAFNALKAALITFGSQLSQALAPKGIRVNAVTPGPIEYPTGNWEMIKGAMPDFYNATRAQMPMGRLGSPEEVARAVVFLASPASSYTSGTNLVVDGAYTKRVQF